MISLETWKILTYLPQLTKMVGNLRKKLLPQAALKSCPKWNKLPNLVTLSVCLWLMKMEIGKEVKNDL